LKIWLTAAAVVAGSTNPDAHALLCVRK
jgi:hypothetical protein